MQAVQLRKAARHRGVIFAFFGAGGLCGLSGMSWGAVMGASHDFSLAPAHAHLNLLGWVTLSLMGSFYATAGASAPSRLAWVNWLLSTGGAIGMPAALAALLSGHPAAEPFVAAGALSALGGMASFLLAALLSWRGRRGPQQPEAPRPPRLEPTGFA